MPALTQVSKVPPSPFKNISRKFSYFGHINIHKSIGAKSLKMRHDQLLNNSFVNCHFLDSEHAPTFDDNFRVKEDNFGSSCIYACYQGLAFEGTNIWFKQLVMHEFQEMALAKWYLDYDARNQALRHSEQVSNRVDWSWIQVPPPSPWACCCVSRQLLPCWGLERIP